MSISKNPKFEICNALNLGIPRCASTSLRSFCKHNNVKFATGRQEGYWGKTKRGNRKNLSVKFAEHLSNKYEKEWENMFTFACIRDPFARSISIMHHPSWVDTVQGNFELFCEHLVKKDYPSKVAQWHAMSPYYHLFDADGNQLISYIWKVEDFEVGLSYVMKNLSIDDNSNYHKRNSATENPKKPSYLSFYSKTTIEMIENVYNDDLRHFQYEFPIEKFKSLKQGE